MTPDFLGGPQSSAIMGAPNAHEISVSCLFKQVQNGTSGAV